MRFRGVLSGPVLNSGPETSCTLNWWRHGVHSQSPKFSKKARHRPPVIWLEALQFEHTPHHAEVDFCPLELGMSSCGISQWMAKPHLRDTTYGPDLHHLGPIAFFKRPWTSWHRRQGMMERWSGNMRDLGSGKESTNFFYFCQRWTLPKAHGSMCRLYILQILTVCTTLSSILACAGYMGSSSAHV